MGSGPSNPSAGLSTQRDQLLDLLRSRLLQLSGFTSGEQPLVVDSSLGVNHNEVAAALRASGYNARSVEEIFGTIRVSDPAIFQLARSINAQVIASDRGRDLTGGFFDLTLHVPNRVRRVESVIRFVEEALK